MHLRNAAFDPAHLKLLQTVHRTAVHSLPDHEQTPVAQLRLAETILQYAAAGEMDATRLLTAALLRHRTEKIFPAT